MIFVPFMSDPGIRTNEFDTPVTDRILEELTLMPFLFSPCFSWIASTFQRRIAPVDGSLNEGSILSKLAENLGGKMFFGKQNKILGF